VKRRYFFRVVESEAPRYIAAGWKVWARERVISVAEPIVCLEFEGEAAPRPVP